MAVSSHLSSNGGGPFERTGGAVIDAAGPRVHTLKHDHIRRTVFAQATSNSLLFGFMPVALQR
jgi:hypothetical protein